MYLEGTKVEVDVEAITVRRYLVFPSLASRNLPFSCAQQTLGVKCILVGKTSERAPDLAIPQYDVAMVRQAVEEILAQ